MDEKQHDVVWNEKFSFQEIGILGHFSLIPLFCSTTFLVQCEHFLLSVLLSSVHDQTWHP